MKPETLDAIKSGGIKKGGRFIRSPGGWYNGSKKHRGINTYVPPIDVDLGGYQFSI